MKERVTQSDVARVAGVHNTTVSLSLRNSQLIPAATRARIQAIACSLGYTPDPALRALAAYRNSRREHRRVETLVYLTPGGTAWGWREISAQTQYHDAIRRKAAELGFQFRPVSLGEPGMTLRRLDRMLRHEGIRCLILAPHHATCADWSALDWSRLCALAIGGAVPPVSPLNRVALDAGAILRLALRQVRRAGYQRIGLALAQRQDELDDRAWSAAFHAEQHLGGGTGEPLSILYLAEAPAGDADALARWHRTGRPEAIIGLCPGLTHLFRRAGLQVPTEVAYADLFLRDAFQTIAGVREHCLRVGELAVEMLAGQLAHNQFGLPAIPSVTSVGGTWCDGASLPSRVPIANPLELAVAPLPANLVA